MRYLAGQFRVWTLAVSAALLPLRAAAQIVIDPFTHTSFNQARNDTIRSHRLLLVYLRGHPQEAADMGNLGTVTLPGDAFAAMDKRTWQNPTLSAWILQHATLVKVSIGEDPGQFEELARQFRTFGRSKADPAVYPHIGVYKDGELIAVIPGNGYEADNGWTLQRGSSVQGMAPIESWRMFPKPVGVLTELDHIIERISARDPVWAADHQRLNPPIEPPEWTLFHNSEDGNAPRVDDPPAGSDLIDRVDQARAAVQAGDLHAAAGLYTWIWERMDALDAVYRPARAAIIQPELAKLASQRPAMRARLTSMRSTIEERFLWWDGQTWLEYLLLNECLGDGAASAAAAARVVGDEDEDALATPDEHAVLDLVYSRTTWCGLAAPTAAQLNWLIAQPRAIAESPQDSDLAITRSRLFFDESCRVYAALLKAGRDDEATTIAMRLIGYAPQLSKRDEIEDKLYTMAGAERALVATALLAGEPRTEQTTWLTQAAAAGQKDPNLVKRLADALRAELNQPSPETKPTKGVPTPAKLR